MSVVSNKQTQQARRRVLPTRRRACCGFVVVYPQQIAAMEFAVKETEISTALWVTLLGNGFAVSFAAFYMLYVNY